MKSCKVVLSLAVLLLATAPLALAQGTYTKIDVQGSLETQAFAIDTAGDIVGLYFDTAGGHGFLLSNGVYSNLDDPGAQLTIPSRINDKGQIVGYTDQNQGFLYDVQTHIFTALSFPNSTATEPDAINNAGIIGGLVELSGKYYGFVLSGQTYRIVAVPGAYSSFIIGITQSNELIIEAAKRGGPSITFSLANGKYSRIPIPLKGTGQADGTNPAGSAFVGSYAPSSTTEGFQYQNKVLTTLVFPGAVSTTALGVNSEGTVVGYFSDASLNEHGFSWTRPADAAKK